MRTHDARPDARPTAPPHTKRATRVPRHRPHKPQHTPATTNCTAQTAFITHTPRLSCPFFLVPARTYMAAASRARDSHIGSLCGICFAAPHCSTLQHKLQLHTTCSTPRARDARAHHQITRLTSSRCTRETPAHATGRPSNAVPSAATAATACHIARTHHLGPNRTCTCTCTRHTRPRSLS